MRPGADRSISDKLLRRAFAGFRCARRPNAASRLHVVRPSEFRPRTGKISDVFALSILDRSFYWTFFVFCDALNTPTGNWRRRLLRLRTCSNSPETLGKKTTITNVYCEPTQTTRTVRTVARVCESAAYLRSIAGVPRPNRVINALTYKSNNHTKGSVFNGRPKTTVLLFISRSIISQCALVCARNGNIIVIAFERCNN